MTKYPNSDCEEHKDIETSSPVCLMCMNEEIERLRAWVEEAIGYVESPMISPSLANEGKALLTPNDQIQGAEPLAAKAPSGMPG